jgi:ADP-heptose:LPS heptosyltransferase
LALKKRHPQSRIFYNCDPDFAAIPRMTGVAEECTHCREIGIVGHWYRFLLAGFYHFGHGDDFSGTTARKPMFQEFCEQFGLPAADAHPSLPLNDEALERVKGILAERGLAEENLILFHCGPTWPVKEWPAESWAALAEGMRRAGFTNLAQVGLGEYLKSQQSQPVRGLVGEIDLGQAKVGPIPQTVSLVGALSLEELIALISLCRLFVGIDSAPLHMAACLRRPAVGIFGPTLPGMFYVPDFCDDFVTGKVECAGCHHRNPRLHWITNCPYEIKCMRTLDATEVLQACLRRMSEPPLSVGALGLQTRSLKG